MKLKLVIAVLSSVCLTGCYSIASKLIRNEYATNIYTEKKSRFEYLQIKKIINSHCGCADAIAEKYVNKKIVYRFYYGCSLFTTKRELYTYCSRGAQIAKRIYEGTTEVGTRYDSRLDPIDKFVLHKIDSFIKTESNQLSTYKLCQKEINGFKKIESSNP
jgi:hypothetical protein